MGWTLTCCFWGKKHRLRRVEAHGRVLQDSRERSGTEVPAPDLRKLGVQLKSPPQGCAYEELFQPKQAGIVSAHGSKLFKRKGVRRAKSFGSSSIFESGSKKLFDKNCEPPPAVRVDRLQEEVEGLKKRLAEEEEEARKLRHEVSYLRSCGVLQSPDRHRVCGDYEKERLLPKDDKGQPGWQSWLGLSLSPPSRLKLEEQLRSIAADEMSKVPAKSLTHSQKALILATKLWNDDDEDKHDKSKHETFCMTDYDIRGRDTLRRNQIESEETLASEVCKETLHASDELTSDFHVPRIGEGAGVGKPSDLSSRPLEEFSFYRPANDDRDGVNYVSPRKLFVKDAKLQRAASCPERITNSSPGYQKEQMTGKSKVDTGIQELKFESPKKSSLLPSLSNLKFESPKKSCSPPSTVNLRFESPRKSCLLPGKGIQIADLDHAQARRFIDLRYQELEEKLSKSPTKDRGSRSSTPESTSPRLLRQELEEKIARSPTRDRAYRSTTPESISPRLLRESPELGLVKIPEEEVLHVSSDADLVVAPPSLECDVLSFTDSDANPCSPLTKPFVCSKSGRLWQPLSPIMEVDSGLSSAEDADSFCSSQLFVSDSVDSNRNSEPRCSGITTSSGSDWGKPEGFVHEGDGVGEVPDDDLFTLSPRRLHQCYNPWDDPLVSDDDNDSKVDSNVDAGTVTSWTSSEESDFDDIVPIQCQSPAFSPKRRFSRKRSIQGKDLIQEYPRDKYFEEMGFKVDEFISSSDSCTSSDVPGSEKENQDVPEVSVVDVGQLTLPASSKGGSPISKNTCIVNDVLQTQDCDIPILASIENLPKWIECHGITVSPVDREVHYQSSATLETKESNLEQRDATCGLSSLDCNSEASRGIRNEGPMPKHERNTKPLEQLEFDRFQKRVEKDDLTLEFSVTQEEVMGQSWTSADLHQADSYRLSLHGFVYKDDAADQSSIKKLVLEKRCLDSLSETREDELRSSVTFGDMGSFLMKLVLQDEETSSAPSCHGQSDDAPVYGETRPTIDSLVLNSGHGDFPKEENMQVQIIEENMQVQVKEETASLNPGAGSCGISRDGDDTFHDCESLLRIESEDQATQYLSPASGDRADGAVPYQSRKALEISPDDRPILGTVATHWGGGSTSNKGLREWDGQGIPNSTSKFKEDQRVNWHSTPFETRLEQALAKQPRVPEVSEQRFVLSPFSVSA